MKKYRKSRVHRARNNVDKFDKSCLLIPTAAKALWLSYRRGNWQVLEKVGLKRKLIEPIFEEFERQHILGLHGNLKSQRQVHALLRWYPPLIDAAVRMVGLYMVVYASDIPEIDNEVERRENVLSRDSESGRPVNESGGGGEGGGGAS